MQFSLEARLRDSQKRKRNTDTTHNKPTHNKHIFNNKHILFALTKMCLYWEEEDFGKIKSLTHFLLFLVNLMVNLQMCPNKIKFQMVYLFPRNNSSPEKTHFKNIYEIMSDFQAKISLLLDQRLLLSPSSKIYFQNLAF